MHMSLQSVLRIIQSAFDIKGQFEKFCLTKKKDVHGVTDEHSERKHFSWTRALIKTRCD